ncbi:MAG TPA: hypothetical protein PKV17_10120 [Aquabacterium sp.]|nr:hypothetical protein [Aquabacterium sp.]HRH29122.1 hypothetical protein [Aquabacterium sp.]
MAYTSASASIGDMTFTLIDLDPSDGIAPSFRFLSSPDQNASIDLFTTLYSQGEEVAAIQTWTPASEGVERAFNLTANTPTQDFRSALSIRDSGISASADAWGHATTFGFVANSLLSPSAGMGLELSAKTLLHITANAQAKVAVGNSQCGPAFLVDDEAAMLGPCSNEYGQAEATLSIQGSFNDGVTYGSFAFKDKVKAVATTGFGRWVPSVIGEYGFPVGVEGSSLMLPGPDDLEEQSKAWSIYMTNPSAKVMLASVSMNLKVLGNGMTAPVPEPDAIWLALCGVVGLGLMKARYPRPAQG